MTKARYTFNVRNVVGAVRELKLEYYIIDESHNVSKCSLLDWVKWCSTPEGKRLKIVSQTVIDTGVRVSTVFLSMDHSFNFNGPPILFETMIFGGPLDGYENRYCTWQEAMIGHKEAIEKALEEQE